MASRKSFLSKPTSNYIFPSTTTPQDNHFNPKSSSDHNNNMLEFDEADLYNNNNNNNNKNNTKKKAFCSTSSSRSTRKNNNKVSIGISQQQACSLPINIPDWSKILKDEYKEHRKWESDDDDEDNHDYDYEDHQNEGIRVPPHEYLARTRGASLSVHEGIGRTLKGRDLRSVRNAIWKKVGFED